MNPSKVVVSLLLTMSLLPLLTGCEGMLPTGGNPPGAVVPNLPPGAPIPGGLRIVSAHATPLLPDNMPWKPGTVNVRFNGAATTPGTVDVSAQAPGWMIYTSAGSASFVAGQTDVQVPIKVTIHRTGGGSNDERIDVPLKISIRGSSAEFQAMTNYRGKP